MSVLTDLIYGGSNAVAGLTEGAVNDAIAKYGADKEIAFPDTAYFFPTIYAATGVKVKTLGDLPACVGVLKSLITNQEDLGQALNAGLATAVGAEILEGLKYVDGANPYENESGIGFVPDPIIRSLGVPLVTGDIPGVAVVLGKADNAEDVVKVVKDYQSKGIMTFMVGDVIEQCAEGGVKMGLELRVVPLGHDVTAVIHVVTVAIRAALIFGNVTPGDLPGLLAYTKERVPAFVNTFGALDAVTVSAGAGAIALGFPVVVVIDLGGTLGQIGKGQHGTAFEHDGIKTGPAICYEGLYGDFYGDFVRRGAQFMAIISNDGWWGDTPGYKHLFTISRLRAIEHRRAIARSANTGRSGFISARGDVGETLGWEERGVISARVPLNSELTFYTRYGDYPARISEYVLLLCLLYYVAYRVKRKNHLVQ